MKKLIFLLMLLLTVPLMAQQPVPASITKPGIAELKLQVAQQAVIITNLKMQILQLQAQLVSAEQVDAQEKLVEVQKATKPETAKK